MAELRRTEAGGFSLPQAHTVAELEEMTPEERVALLLTVEELFSDLPSVCLPQFFERLCRSGCEIYQKKIRTDLPIGQRVRLCDATGHFFALGQVGEYENGSAIRSIKIFELK